VSYDLSQLQTERVFLAPRIVLLGTHKIGKSTFATSAPNPIVIPVKGEEGVDDLIGNGVQATPTCESIGEVIQWLYALYSGDHDRQTVVIDSTSALQPLLWDETIRRWNAGKEEKQKEAISVETIGGGYGKGFNEALVEWRLLTEALDALRRDRNMTSILIGHVIVKQVTDPMLGVFDAFEWDIDRRAANMLYRWSDCILFAKSKAAVKKEDKGFGTDAKRAVDLGGGARYLFTQDRPSHPGGGRGVYGRIPYELPLNWGSFMSAVAAIV